jgi:hypothetical protein
MLCESVNGNVGINNEFQTREKTVNRKTVSPKIELTKYAFRILEIHAKALRNIPIPITGSIFPINGMK